MKKNVIVRGENLHAVVSILRRLPNGYESCGSGKYNGIYNNVTEEEVKKIERYISE